MIQKRYDRLRAVLYARRWAFSRNPAYFSFNSLGGDCTNFVSQCLFAGSGVMNYTPVFGWFYRSANDRTASWTGVEFLYNFLISNRGDGPAAQEVPLCDLQLGDVIQLGRETGDFTTPASSWGSAAACRSLPPTLWTLTINRSPATSLNACGSCTSRA